ncbi:MAG: phosphatidate cytidylyltransferase [Candidatus Aminicenantes bacterium]|nr:phosphatidate cytidylyltransferase [Candidatus Aminicenantes bacterium]
MNVKEFITRTITAFFLIAGAYALIKYTPDRWFSLALFLLISAGAYELVKLTQPVKYSMILVLLSGLSIALSFTFRKPDSQPDLLPGIIMILVLTGLFFLFSIRRREDLNTFVKDMGIHFLIIFYLYVPLYFILELKRLGPHFLFFMIFVIAVGDTGAYFVGSAIGKHKIYPVASPKKSLEGLIAAVITAALTGWLSIVVFPLPVKVWQAMATAGIIGLLSQLSDPVESLFKRAAGKKDSGALLPGHGGVLDRVDSYIFCAPVLFYIITYLWK